MILVDKAKVNKNISPEPSPSEELSSCLGWISNGTVHFNDCPDNNTIYIFPCPEVQLLVNNQFISGRVAVSPSDNLELIPTSYTVPGQLKVIVSSDKMSAFLDVTPDCTNTYVVEDTAPSNEILVKVKPIKRNSISETVESLLELLKKHNVTYGIDIQCLGGIVSNPNPGMVLVAKGLPSSPAIDDSVELPMESKTTDLSTDNISETIDFREMQSVTSVSAGDVLAVRIPGRTGNPGKTVNGQIINPKEPRKITLLTGSGAELLEDGNRAVATTDGLPKIKKSGSNWLISVDPMLVIPGDVNVKTGNIRFKGNVNILGSVENMNVSASGDISVANIITKCKITAGGNVTVKGNIVNSEIISGGFIVICQAIKPLLHDLLRSLEDLYISASMMQEKLPTRSNIIYGNVLTLLIEKRFTNFNGLIEKVNKKFKELDMKLLGAYETKLQRVLNSLTGINILHYRTPGDFQRTIQELTAFFYYSDTLQSSRSVVSINVALNSVIKSSGDVFVEGSGCFNTVISAGGIIHVEGVVRGGLMEAKDDIYINELGSEIGAKSVVSVEKGKKIKLATAYEGATVQVGKMSRIIEKKMKNIQVSLDDDGYLWISNY